MTMGDTEKYRAARDRGNQFVKLGQEEEALVAYTEALQLAESDELRVPIWANRALAALRLGRFLEALDDSDQALALKPEHVKALFRRGQALSGLRRHVEAVKCLEEVKIFEPQNEEVAAALRQAQAAAAQKRGKFDFRPMLAEACLQETLQLEHSRPISEFCNDDAMELVELNHGLGWRTKRDVAEGELLVVGRPLVFAAYTELRQGHHQILVDKALAASGSEREALCHLCGPRNAQPPNTGVLCEETARELLRRNCVICHTGIGVWHETSFLNHADAANASRYFIADWVVLRAKQDIPPQTEVTISYIDACADYSLQASWLESLGIPDTALKERARRWAETSDPELLAVQRCLSSGQSEIGSCVGGPLEEKKRFLHQIGAETGLIWCWGQLVQWLRGLKAAAQNAGETAAALGAALAAAELLSRHLVHDMQVLEAWADCAAMLVDLPESISASPEFAEVMGLCIDAMQDNIEFFFGRKSVEDVDFSTLVLEWATLRWFHYAQTAPPQQAAEKQSPVLGELD